MFESFLTTDLPGLGFTSLNQLVLPFLASRVAVMKGFRDAQYSEEEAAIQRCICPFNDSILLIMREANCDRLEAAVPEIQRIFQVFQSPSFSVGVLHRNRTIFTRCFGYSDMNAGRVPDSETIYCLGSCTKAFTALALVLLTQQGRIKWEAPISDCLPAFDTPYNPDVGHNSTLANILSHSAGLAPCSMESWARTIPFSLGTMMLCIFPADCPVGLHCVPSGNTTIGSTLSQLVAWTV
jgi:CubicO group peptidase (beta-lactamase class C family)